MGAQGVTIALYKWKDSFSIGLTNIDQQHRSFLSLLNDCHRQISAGKKVGSDAAIFERLKAYAAMHFRFEEDLMQSSGFPEIEQHKKQHTYFESQVAELETAHKGGSDRTAESILSFLRDWFLKHILEQDKNYAPYVR
jgi:hemerythrin-like metal-binding protein